MKRTNDEIEEARLAEIRSDQGSAWSLSSGARFLADLAGCCEPSREAEIVADCIRHQGDAARAYERVRIGLVGGAR